MSVRIHNITFDCADARGLASFWSTVTGWHLFYDDDPEVVVAPSYPFDGTGLLFIPVPEGKSGEEPAPPRPPARVDDPGRDRVRGPRRGRVDRRRPPP